jgi:hypothetical protein
MTIGRKASIDPLLRDESNIDILFQPSCQFLLNSFRDRN